MLRCPKLKIITKNGSTTVVGEANMDNATATLMLTC